MTEPDSTLTDRLTAIDGAIPAPRIAPPSEARIVARHRRQLVVRAALVSGLLLGSAALFPPLSPPIGPRLADEVRTPAAGAYAQLERLRSALERAAQRASRATEAAEESEWHTRLAAARVAALR